MYRRKGKSWGILLLAAVFIYFAYVLVDQQRLLFVKQKEYESMQLKIQQEKERNEELARQKEILNTDEYKERVAREMGMVKNGEKVFIDVNK